MRRTAARGGTIKTQRSDSPIRHSRENGNPSDLRNVRCAKSGGRAPALRAGVARTSNTGCVRPHHITTMRIGALRHRHSRENGNPSDLRNVQYTASGGQAPALRAGAARTGMAKRNGQHHIAVMRIGALRLRHSRENGNPSDLRYLRATKSRGTSPRATCRSVRYRKHRTRTD